MSRSNMPYGLTCAPHERRQAANVRCGHARHPARFGEHALQHQRIDVDQAGLQQVQRMHRRLLVVQPVAGDLAALAEEDEPVGGVPGLDDVQPLVDFAPQRLVAEIAAQEDRLDRLAQFGQRLVGRVLDVGCG